MEGESSDGEAGWEAGVGEQVWGRGREVRAVMGSRGGGEAGWGSGVGPGGESKSNDGEQGQWEEGRG